MKILFAVLQVALILLLKADPLLAQGDNKEVGIFDSGASPKRSDPDSRYLLAGHDFLDIFEALARSSQPEAHIAEDGDRNSSLLPLGETEIKEKLLPPAVLKSSDEKPSETETHVAGVSMKAPPDIGEMTDKEVEASPESEETGIKGEVPAVGYVAWRKKPIGQRALELARIESDIEILDILHKEYGKEQMDRWLGISKGNEQINSEHSY